MTLRNNQQIMTKIKNKKIILAITPDIKLYLCIEENLKNIGFKVYTITFDENFKYKTIKDKLNNLFKKIFFNDKNYKRKLIRNFHSETVQKKISLLPESDYSLTIRADLFDKNAINKITQLSLKNYAYQWDGFSRFKEAVNLIPFYDKFYVFDKKDLNQKNKTYPTTNFYFDCYDYLFKNTKPQYDFYYIGSYDNRIDKLIYICELLHKKGCKLNIILNCSPKKTLKKYSYINFSTQPFSYFENLKMIANSKSLIDINHDFLHEGLSLRIFESIGYGKKIITTNPIIKNYDFYDQTNIFYINTQNDNNPIDDFLSSEYKTICPTLKYKYSFTNWIKYILEIEGNIPIDIP